MFDLLRPYQIPHAQAGLRIIQRQNALLDASDTGTGKTFSTIAVCKARGVVPVVVAPKAVLPAWERAATHLGWSVQAVNYEKARGSRAKKGAKTHITKDGIEKRCALSDFGEEKPWGKGSYWQWHHEFDTMVFDEVHLCAGTSTLNSKMLIAAKRQAGTVVMLSATAADSPLDLKAIGFALGLHSLKDWQSFLYEYGCHPDWTGRFVFGDPDDPAVAKAHLDRLHAMLFPHRGVRLRKKEIPGFPATQCGVRMIEADEDTRIRVEALRKAARGGPVANLAAPLELELVNPLLDLMEGYKDTVQVVFCNYRETARQLGAKLKCPVVWGEQDPGERQKIIDDCQADRLKVLVSTYGAGGAGVGFHGQTDRTVWLLPTFDGRQLQQAYGRVNRDGGGFSQQFLVGISGTYHDQILEVVKDKLERMDALNDGALLGE